MSKLRLKSTPALDWLTTAERAQLLGELLLAIPSWSTMPSAVRLIDWPLLTPMR